ncbi:hypothetical protein ABFY60_11145 [Lysinibacillus pakistanensis]|uniref:hypothetical protein n=1 Tax=Lysinibacillus pakistanensis TaxID=759811 RepID=UPI003D267BED
MSRVYSGDTARLFVEFRDFEGNTIQPDTVTLTIYNENEVVLKTITNGDIKQHDDMYFYDYTHKEKYNYIYEFNGKYLGYPIVARSSVNVVFS